MPRARAQIDQRAHITRPTAITDADHADIIATKWGFVLVTRHLTWTWYRWILRAQFWSVTVEQPRDAATATKEAARLIRTCWLSHRRR